MKKEPSEHEFEKVARKRAKQQAVAKQIEVLKAKRELEIADHR